MENVIIEHLGRRPYQPVWDYQRQVHAQVLAGERPMTVLVVEHEPVITLGRRAQTQRNLLADRSRLERMGVDLCPIDRGGDVTYHGPGQLVVYPFVPLRELGLNIRGYIRLLERSVIQTLAHFGVEAYRDVSAVGVWVGGKEAEGTEGRRDEGTEGATGGLSASARADKLPVAPPSGSPQPATRHPHLATRNPQLEPPSKIAAIGVRVQRWVTMHGLALNVTTDLSYFDLIVPCGLTGRAVSSLHRLLGEGCPPFEEVADVLTEALRSELSALPGRKRARKPLCEYHA